jgi:hypothetical protein
MKKLSLLSLLVLASCGVQEVVRTEPLAIESPVSKVDHKMQDIPCPNEKGEAYIKCMKLHTKEHDLKEELKK